MNPLKLILITGFFLIFLLPGLVQPSGECTKMEATFSWDVQEEAVTSTFVITSNDIGKNIPDCPFKIDDFTGNKISVSTQDGSSGVITSSDVGKKPTYYWEELGTTETICNLKLIEFDGNKRSATFGTLGSIEKIENKTITSDDVGNWFELDSCNVKVDEFDVNSGKLLIEGMIKYITAGDIGSEIFFDECKWKLEKFGCAAEKTENKSVEEVQDNKKENDTEPENQTEISKETSNGTAVNDNINISKDNNVVNVDEPAGGANQTEINIIKNENLNSCSGFDAGGFCIPFLALVIVILIVIIVLVLMIFSLIKK